MFRKKMLEIGMKRTKVRRDWARVVFGAVSEDGKGGCV